MAQDLNNAIDKKTKIWIFLMKFGALSGCHQMYDRSFSFRGFQFPVCARCTGIYLGYIIAVILFIIKVKISLNICGISILIMICDGLLQLFKIKKSTNIRRLFTGVSFGIGLAFLAMYAIRALYQKV
ncbi:DUF2085 domain-containing protein [Clostridium beijerinckii]|uniref:DUF2085 domain-containing protein n=1 Tax=Clostridium beijerinckii TaxID=1520 RepID=UPI000B321F61